MNTYNMLLYREPTKFWVYDPGGLKSKNHSRTWDVFKSFEHGGFE